MFHSRFNSLLAALSMLMLIPPVAFAQQTPTQPSVVSFYSDNNGIPLVNVDFGKGVIGTFAIDTGASTTLISEALVARLGLAGEPAYDENGKPEQEEGQNVAVVKVPQLRLGLEHLTDQFMEVVNGKRLRRLAHNSIDGLIGNTVLGHFAFLFDFQKHQLTLWPGGHLTAAQRAEVHLGQAFSCPLVRVKDQFQFSVPVMLNDKTICDLLIDTGADTTGILAKTAADLGLKPVEIRQTLEVYRAKGQLQCRIAILSGLAVAGYTVQNAAVYYPTDASIDYPAVLGRDFLCQHRLLLDYPAQRMYFQPVTPTAVTVPWTTPFYEIPTVSVVLKDGKSHLFGIENCQSCVVPTLAHLLDPVGTPQDGQITTVSSDISLAQGRISLEHFVFQIQDLPEVRPLVPGIEGILGSDFLRQYAVKVDFSKHEFVLMTPGHFGRMTGIMKDKDAVQVPLTLSDDGYAIGVQIDDQSAPFVVSFMGNLTRLSSPTLVASLHPQRTQDTKVAGLLARELRLHRLSVGGFLWNAPVVSDMSVQEPTRPNTLGNDYWRRYQSLFDFVGQTLYLVPDLTYQEDPNEHIGIGITPRVTAEGRIYVADLDLPSPAQEAGLLIGDELVAVNGLVVTKTPLDRIGAEFKKPEGAEVVLTIQRKGEDKTREVKLKVRKLL